MMPQFRGFLIASLFLPALAACGDKPAPAVAPGGDDPPAARPPADEKELAELERQIEAKAKELAELRKRADALRARIAAAKGPGGGKAYTSVERLLAAMPKEKYPQGPRKLIELNAADRWLKDNVAGKAIEWTAEVEDVKELDTSVVNRDRKGPTYALIFYHRGEETFHSSDWGNVFVEPGQAWGGESRLGDDAVVAMIARGSWGFGEQKALSAAEPLDEATAKRLRDLRGKVTFRAKIEDARFGYCRLSGQSSAQKLVLMLVVKVVAVNGVEVGGGK